MHLNTTAFDCHVTGDGTDERRLLFPGLTIREVRGEASPDESSGKNSEEIDLWS